MASSAVDSIVTVDEHGGQLVKYVPLEAALQRKEVPATRYRKWNRERKLVRNSRAVTIIDTICDVGAIPYSEGVSPSGAKTISVPIATAPGDEFAPSISLRYNSQGIDGLAGRGWDLSRIPSITAIPKNLYYHEYVSPARLDTLAAFALDGNPLVQNNMPSASTGFPLQTARGNIIARMNVDAAGKLCGFVVRYPDGSEGVFEHTGQSGAHHSFPLALLTDSQGRQIRFQYRQGCTLNIVESISYGHRLSSRILFSYNTQAPFQRYYCGINLGSFLLLSDIQSYDGKGRLLGQYSLTHTLRDGYPLLTQVDLSREDGSLNPLRLSYGDGTDTDPEDWLRPSLPYYYSSTFGTDELVFQRGRFYPDSYADGNIRYPDFPTYDVVSYSTILGKTVHAYGSRYSSSQVIAISQNLGYPSPEDRSFQAGDGFQQMTPVDIDGDGVDEVVKINLGLNGETSTRLNIEVYGYSPGWNRRLLRSFSVDVAGVVIESFLWKRYVSPHQRLFRFGQFRGDGKTQLLAVSYDTSPNGDSQPSTAALIDLESGQKIYEYEDFDLTRSESDFFCAVDINGDGRTDVIKKYGSEIAIYSLIQNQLLLTSQGVPLGSDSALNVRTIVADFNADGYPDFLTPPISASTLGTWQMNTFTGTGFVSDTFSFGSYATDEDYLPVDVDGDGLTDLVRRSGTTLSTFLNKRGNIIYYSPHNYQIEDDGHLLSGRRSLDMPEKGIFVFFDEYAKEYEFTFDTGAWLRLGGMTDSFGNDSYYSYEYLTSSDQAYLRDSSRTVSAGYSTHNLSVSLLTEESSYTGTGSLYKNLTYKYGGCVSHNTGLGFCGFSRTVTSDLIRGTVTQTRFNPEKMGVPLSMTVALGSSPGVPFLNTQYTWDDHSTTYGKMDPRLTSTVQTDSLSRTSTWVSYLYNTYGYQTFSQTTKYPVGEGIGERLHHNTRYHDVVYADRYILGVVQADGQTRIPRNPSDTCLTTYTTFEYDSMYRPSAVRQYCRYGPYIDFATGGLIEKETLYSYDSHGNVTSERTARYGSQTYLEESFAYDSTGRFLISETDSRRLTTTYGDHDVWGNPRVTTDPMGLVTRDSLDAWGNLVLRRNWDGSADTTRTLWGGEGLYKTISSGSITPRHITHYDALGREIRSEEERFDGSFLKTDRTYDAHGRLATETRPYKTAPDTYVNTVYSYDAYGRPLGFVQGDRSETVTYSGLSTTTTRDLIPSIVTTDAWGQTVSVQDPGGTISYSLRVDGLPDSITAPGGVVTSFSYDAYGRRRRMVDPSAGVLTDSLVWYADGTSKLFHRNPGGQITTSYNKWGDVTRIDREGEFSTVYTYDAYGRLNACSNSNGTGIHYYLHPSSPRPGGYLQTGPDDYILELTYNRDSWGRITSELYDLTTPSDYCTVVVSHEYAHGYKTRSMVSGETTILELVAEDDSGLPSQVTTGSVLRRYTYDDYGRPATRSYGYYMPLSTEFSPATGNLRSRTDYSGDAETFSYDALGRLTSCSLDGFPNPPGSGVSYSFNGNILSKSGYGSMSYSDVSHPYRVTSITPERPGLDVPEREQTISYTSSGRPASISEGGVTAAFTYDTDGQRLKMAVTDSTGGRILTRYYLGGCLEVDVDPSGVEKKKFYLGGDYYSSPAVLVKTGSAPATFYNIIRDCQGSIMRVTSENGGSMAGNYSYDAWGRMRNPGSYSPYAAGTEPELFLGRGWCGHEHLPWFGLVNLNARLYDPVLGRFLSPDPYVQAPDFTQSFNRYSYCLNNPLKYTDPSGEYVFWDDLLAGTIGGFINWLSNGAKFTWEGLAYFGVGFASGVGSLYISPVLTAGLSSGANSIIQQGFSDGGKWNGNLIDWGQVGFSAVMGSTTSYLGSALSSSLSSSLGNLTSKIPGKAWAGLINKGITGGTTGLAIGAFTSAVTQLKSGEPFSWDQFWNSTLKSGLSGMTLGAISGMAEGIQQAHANHENPWAVTKKQLSLRNNEIQPFSLGANSKPLQTKRVGDKYLKKLGVDAHSFKEEFVGSTEISHYELHLATNKQVFLKSLQLPGRGIPTDLFIIDGKAIRKNIW